MWLIDTSIGKPRLQSTSGSSFQTYAALSQVWIPGEELSFQELQRLHQRTSLKLWTDRFPQLVGLRPRAVLGQTSVKVQECCAFALARGYRGLWVDSCRIDKTSSTGLSEAVNPVYQWYANVTVCYASRHDADDEENPCSPWSQSRRSKWFSRGWTLQELREVVFVSKH
ncbi:hypothetical protein FKP32DRAFT_1588932 [Trametes sanguinea]|nr:hypothetical protein FKP32DRAFT_1588932 [Trametes sanguinea]